MNLVVITLTVIGLFFLIVAAVGFVRLPDVFTRSHALAITDTVGVGFVLSGLAFYQGPTTGALKTVLILILLFHLNPVISQMTVRAALRSGVKPWVRGNDPGDRSGTVQESP
jgi:multicomponent Na+:H+ antiporter subunit G